MLESARCYSRVERDSLNQRTCSNRPACHCCLLVITNKEAHIVNGNISDADSDKQRVNKSNAYSLDIRDSGVHTRNRNRSLIIP